MKRRGLNIILLYSVTASLTFVGCSINTTTIENQSNEHVLFPSQWDSIVGKQAEVTINNNELGELEIFLPEDSNISMRFHEVMETENYYVVSCAVNSNACKAQNNDLTAVSISGNPNTDYNYDVVLAEASLHDLNVDQKMRRLIKSDSNGMIDFVFNIGTSNNLMSGKLIISEFQITPLQDDNDYVLLESGHNSVRVIMSAEDRNNIKSEIDLQKWLNKYEELRLDIKWFVGDLEPYNGLTDFVLTETFPYYGLAGDPIYINRDFVVDDLNSIYLSENPLDCVLLWKFLHEMSHTFDGIENSSIKDSWNFDKEFFATLKVTYALSKHGFGMDSDSLGGNEIIDHFKQTDTLKNGVYSSDGLIYTLVRTINRYDGRAWDHLHNAIILTQNADIIPHSFIEKFRLFWNCLNEDLGTKCENLLSEKEWRAISSKYSYEVTF